MDTSSLSRKEREKLQRKKEILAAAANLFARKGYRETTLEDIAAEAEFGIGTLYNYFASKEDIFKSILKQQFEEGIERISEYEATTGTFKEFMLEYVSGQFNYLQQNMNGIKLVIAFYTSMYDHPISKNDPELTALQNRHDQIMNRRIEKGINDKEIKAYSPDMIRRYLDGFLFPYFAQLLIEEKESIPNPKAHIDFIMDVLMGGIQYDKPEKQ